MELKKEELQKKAKNVEFDESKKFKFSASCLSKLEALLHDAYGILHPRPNDYKIRSDLIQIFNLMAKDIHGSVNGFPNVEAFGSFIMDMFTAKSDLDLSINFSNDAAVFPRDGMISTLRKFAKRLYVLQRGGHVHGIQPIMRARVPILKVVDRGTGVECDISVENKDGIARSKILTIISTIDERFQKLSFLMKAWGKKHDINSSKDRTLNSLSIISLVAFHLQTRDPPILPPFSALLRDGTDFTKLENDVRGYQKFGKRNKESLAKLFITLLIKLSSAETLWSRGLCVSIYEGSWISKTWNSGIANMSVEDFADRSQNIARSVGKAEVLKIHKCISITLGQLTSFMEGRIQVHQLKSFLFGLDSDLSAGGSFINSTAMKVKRSIPFEDSNPAKRLQFTGAREKSIDWSQFLPVRPNNSGNLNPTWARWPHQKLERPQIAFEGWSSMDPTAGVPGNISMADYHNSRQWLRKGSIHSHTGVSNPVWRCHGWLGPNSTLRNPSMGQQFQPGSQRSSSRFEVSDGHIPLAPISCNVQGYISRDHKQNVEWMPHNLRGLIPRGYNLSVGHWAHFYTNGRV